MLSPLNPQLPAINSISNPTIPLYTIRSTPHAGRALFATQPIAANHPILSSTDLSITVLLRPYRREVCAHCFFYDLGSTLPIRCTLTNYSFCSAACQTKWTAAAGPIGIAAWSAAEKLSKHRSGDQRDADYDMVDPDLARPLPAEIVAAWEGVAKAAALIRLARAGAEGKQYRKAMAAALSAAVVPDVLAFCVSGILERYQWPQRWAGILELVPDATPYHSSADLAAFVRSYVQLLAVLPEELLEFTTPEVLFVLSSRDSHNSFGIRSLEDEGSEFFGYGCWVSASFFNHSCGPNVRKERVGREWRFVVDREVRGGEELCISYLSGEERGLGREKRRERLRRTWGFECGCGKCGKEL